MAGNSVRLITLTINLDTLRSASSLSPPPIAEDVFFTMTEEKDASSPESDYEDPNLEVDSSLDDILCLGSSLRGTEFFRDLEGGDVGQVEIRFSAPRLARSSPVSTHHLSPGMHFHHTANSSSCPGSLSSHDSPAHTPPMYPATGSMDVQQSEAKVPTAPNDPPVHLTDPGGGRGGDSDPESFPILVRSMSTSRRHSWEVPVSPLDPGRRLSLDTSAIDSDEEREDSSVEYSSRHLHKTFIYPESSIGSVEGQMEPVERDVSNHKPKETDSELEGSGKNLYSRSDILASEESRAACLSRVLETSKQAARAAGEDPDLENLKTAEGQSHIAKQRTESREEKVSSQNVTWYEFLSNENDEEDRTEKVERGTKVKRTLSSLKSRMAGSFNKDKGKSREREQQKEKGKEREKERETKEKLKLRRNSSGNIGNSSCSGHQLVPGTFSTWATCSLCSKTLQRKHGMQCLNCAVNVHKNCRNLLPECSSSKNKLRKSLKRSTGTVQSAVQFYNQGTTREMGEVERRRGGGERERRERGCVGKSERARRGARERVDA
ncbi:hypothetical protein JZ751_024553 [Albula glossodonta]|uniref:Phorbol-ester/DAG-type domain-containing protein n=1 Tax=Albula glossodonta TaxID=121402 RepID=A0A8T2PDN3_9TELE|nr:hypothetical protein JZ751_024553 [Albula glossodonta]